MNRSNLAVKAILATALAAMAGMAGAATVTATAIDYAKEVCDATTAFKNMSAVYTSGVPQNANFYVDFVLNNGTFTGTNPTATTSVGGTTATQVGGGSGFNFGDGDVNVVESIRFERLASHSALAYPVASATLSHCELD